MSNINTPVVLHKGIYKPVASVAEAVFMITGMTIGAGVLGIPYAVSRVGLKIGLLYILGLGMVMLCLNLMIGDIAVRTKQPMQLPGFAGKYLGVWAKVVLTITIVLGAYGALLAYVVGEGQALAAIFGGQAVMWSVIFWGLGSVVVWHGLYTAKSLEKYLSFIVIALITGLSLFLLPKFQIANWQYFDLAKFFLPYGVILFALHAAPAVVEAHALLPGSQKHFRKALIIGTLIPIAVYFLFALAVVGYSGLQTTEIATVGLGKMLGNGVLLIGNIFAALAMGTGFFGLGVALKQTLTWDWKLKIHSADFLVIVIPLILFLFGCRNFISIISIVGGVFVGIEALLMVAIGWVAREKGDLDSSRFGLSHFWLLAIPILLTFVVVTVLGVAGMMR